MTARSAARIEHEADATRERISELLEELRDRISPGVIVDEVLGYSANGHGVGGAGKEFVQTLSDQARRNPLACAVIGVGVAWLMMSDRRMTTASLPAYGGNGESLGTVKTAIHAVGDKADAAIGATRRAATSVASGVDAATSGISSAASSVSNAASDAASTLSGAASSLKDAAAGAYETGQHLAHDMKDKVVLLEEKAVDLARKGGQRIAEAGSKAGHMTWDLLNDQPLVTAGIGLAVGAAIGALLPSTATEDEYLGKYSDDLKDQAQGMAKEQVEKVKAQVESVKVVAERAYDAAKEDVQKLAAEAKDGMTKEGLTKDVASSDIAPKDKDTTSKSGISKDAISKDSPSPYGASTYGSSKADLQKAGTHTSGQGKVGNDTSDVDSKDGSGIGKFGNDISR